ncbi:MAG: glycosyltransferase family 4 protein [Candidatus Omnitrophota bacterium]|nr:MAG: glycosyltransferase family 4 protein [Candidatus Omnitrophota bacterium]
MRKVMVLYADLFNLGGIQKYNRHLCDALETIFSEYEFLALSMCDSKKNQFKHWRNIKIWFCGHLNLKFIRNFLFILKTLLVALREKPTFLICAHVNLSPLALFFKKMCGLKYAVLTHGVDVWGLTRGLRYQGLKCADVITAVSNYTKSRMVANGIDEHKIELLQNTIDTSCFYPQAPNRSLLRQLRLENKRVLLTVGRISSQERYKGHNSMLHILKKLPEDYVWIVIGDGDDVSGLQQKAQKFGAIHRVRFLRSVENERLIDYYNLCNIFVMPSKGEGFGIVFLEAMACGKPVIGGNKDGSTEPLMNGKLGFLVDPDDEKEIIEAIRLASESNEERTNPGYLRSQVDAFFGLDVFRRRVKEIFEKQPL